MRILRKIFSRFEPRNHSIPHEFKTTMNSLFAFNPNSEVRTADDADERGWEQVLSPRRRGENGPTGTFIRPWLIRDDPRHPRFQRRSAG